MNNRDVDRASAQNIFTSNQNSELVFVCEQFERSVTDKSEHFTSALRSGIAEHRVLSEKSSNTSGHQKITDHRVLIIDCQTTGPNPAQSNLLEIAWVVASASGAVSDINSFLVKQPEDQPVPKRIQAITGIQQEEMSAAIDKEEVRRLLLETLETLDAPSFCIAHFARFEKPFIEDLLGPLPFELLCTFEIAKRLFPNLPSKGLRAVSGYFGTVCGELKRANAHVVSTLAVWSNLAPQLQQTGLQQVSELTSWIINTPLPKCGKFEYPLDKSKRLQMPDKPGVYRMLSKTNEVLYVGKATSLKHRVNSYFRGQTGKDSKTKELLSQVWDIQVSICESPLEAALLETDEIKRLDPPYNRALKRRRRNLVFYSPDFTSSSETQDEQHPVGPFANAGIIEPLIKIDSSLKTQDFIADIFHYELPKVLLSEGFELFCINEAIEVSSIQNARSLLALGLWLYRKRLREKAEAQRLEELDEDAVDAADQVEIVESPQAESSTTPESIPKLSTAKANDMVDSITVGEKFGRMLRHVARQYLRAKQLTKLLHSEVAFTHKETPRLLKVSRGTITGSVPDQDHHADVFPAQTVPTKSGEHNDLSYNYITSPWKGLDIDTYDRMSVLLTEVSRSGAALATL